MSKTSKNKLHNIISLFIINWIQKINNNVAPKCVRPHKFCNNIIFKRYAKYTLFPNNIISRAKNNNIRLNYIFIYCY